MNNKRSGTETGVYVVCTDKGLLDRINNLLKSQGIIGITDAEGRVHYIVDGRSNPSKAASGVNEVVVKNASTSYNGLSMPAVQSVLRSAMIFYDFDMSLLGTHAIFEIVMNMIESDDIYQRDIKKLYSKACKTLNLSYSQIERDIRYSVKKSSFDKSGIKAAMIFRILADDVSDQIKKGRTDPVLTQ